MASHHRFGRRSAGLLLTIVLLVGCAKGERPTLEPAAATTKPVATTTTAATTTTVRVPTTGGLGPEQLLGFIATPTGDPVVYSMPDTTAPQIEVGPTTPMGAPTTFAVVGDPSATTDGWLEVALPIRPNEGTGFVKADAVTVSKTQLRAFVNLSDRSLKIERDGMNVLERKIAIGTTTNPTPVGGSFVTELIESENPGGAYGPYAFGLSLHSETLSEFGGGDGQVGIHGTNQPDKIGDAVSHGCIRLDNDSIKQLVGLDVPLGMPVFIT